MRVRIIFELKNQGAMVDFHHQPQVASLIKSLIKGNDTYRHFRDYNFSALKGQTRTSKYGLHFLSSKITLVISSRKQAFITFLLDQLVALKTVVIGELQLRLIQVEREIFPAAESHTKFLCLSPLVLANPEEDPVSAKKFIPPTLDNFSDLVYEGTMMRMEATGLYTVEQLESFNKFQIVPDKNYLNKLKANEKKFARIYTVYDGAARNELRGYTFPFVLYADPLVQEYVIECGLGACTTRGYGMVDLVDDYQTKRVLLEEYNHMMEVERPPHLGNSSQADQR
ncbi:MAG: CRISPR-associated endoribonuclease Cas6 [Thermonemataceae bacterium]